MIKHTYSSLSVFQIPSLLVRYSYACAIVFQIDLVTVATYDLVNYIKKVGELLMLLAVQDALWNLHHFGVSSM